jgi:hypothetical protein
MKKLLILTVLVFSFFALPALAECPAGQHWVENNTVIPEHYIDGACNAWTEPVCLHYHNICVHWHGFTCATWVQSCGEWTSAECIGYEQILVPEEIIPGGECVNNPPPVVEKVVGCMNERAINYNSSANSEGKCYFGGMIIIKPQVVADSVVLSGGIGGKTFTFRTNKFMSCGLLISQHSNPFALNADSVPTLNGWQALGGLDSLYGYDRLASQESGNNTGHQIGVALEPGKYFARLLCDWNGKDILGQEYSFEIK